MVLIPKEPVAPHRFRDGIGIPDLRPLAITSMLNRVTPRGMQRPLHEPAPHRDHRCQQGFLRNRSVQ